MICLCCGKPIKENAKPEELINGWHNSCVRRFFGTKEMPEIDVTNHTIETIANEFAKRGFTVPGVQKKLSLHLSDEKGNKSRLTLVGYPAGFILKPQTERFMALPESEHLIMTMARKTGIRTVPFALIKIADGSLAYITRRIDRTGSGVKIAMEDFCQLDLRITADKYKGSYERCGKVIDRYSDSAGLDMAEFFTRIVFSFATGNSDMHLKNFSLIETAPGSGEYHLSEAYDMLPVNVILPEDKDQMALTLNGKKRNLHRNDFLILAESLRLNRRSAEKMIDGVVSREDSYLDMCAASLLPEDYKMSLKDLIAERMDAIRF